MSGTTEAAARGAHTAIAVALGMLVLVAMAVAGIVIATDDGAEEHEPPGSLAYIIAFEEHQVDAPVRYTEGAYQDERHLRWTQTRTTRSGDQAVAYQLIVNGTERFTRLESPDTWRIEPLGEPLPQTPLQKQFTLLSGLTGARLGESRIDVMADLRDRDPGTEMRITGRDRVLDRDVFVVESGPLAVEDPSGVARRVSFRAWVDDETLVVLRWETTLDGRVVVRSEATLFAPGAPIPADAFTFPDLPPQSSPPEPARTPSTN